MNKDGLFLFFQHLEQFVQFWRHDNLRAAVLSASFCCFIVGHWHEFSTSARLYLQWIDLVFFNQDTYYRSCSDYAQVPVVLELCGMNRFVVGVSFNAYVNFSLFVQHFGQFTQGFFATLVQFGTSGLKQQFIRHGHIDLAILFSYGQFVTAEAKQGILYTVEQILHLGILLVYHALQFLNGFFAFIQFF